MPTRKKPHSRPERQGLRGKSASITGSRPVAAESAGRASPKGNPLSGRPDWEAARRRDRVRDQGNERGRRPARASGVAPRESSRPVSRLQRDHSERRAVRVSQSGSTLRKMRDPSVRRWTHLSIAALFSGLPQPVRRSASAHGLLPDRVPDGLQLEEARDRPRALLVRAAVDDPLDVVGGQPLELG